jgi:tetratricopeptide (TPR) repeat protein
MPPPSGLLFSRLFEFTPEPHQEIAELGRFSFRKPAEPRKITCMAQLLKTSLWLALSAAVCAQQAPPPSSVTPPENQSSPGAPGGTSANSAQKKHSTSDSPNLSPPRSDRVSVDDLGPATGESSSKDSEIDLSVPADDAKDHPRSSSAVAEAEAGVSPDGITEVHEWDPHKAAKDVEVGDFYYKKGNYKAAEDRYREALRYKEDDAVATIRLAESLEKLGAFEDARSEYESYLKILPHGPETERVQKEIQRLRAKESANNP